MTRSPAIGARPPRAAVIGAGTFGEQHIRAFGGDEWELVAVADIDADRAQLRAERYLIPAYFSDAETLLRETRPDAVTIATTPANQVDLAISALDVGCAVLLEKPIALSTKEADRLIKHDVDHKILPGHVLRFDPALGWLREQVGAGTVGTVLGISASRDRERGHVERYGHTHPAFLTAIHDIDLALWITGSTAASVSAHAASSGRGTYPDLVTMTITTVAGEVWSLRTSWLLPPGAPPADRFEVYGTDGVASVEVTGARVTRHVAAASTTSATEEVDELAALGAEIAHLRERTIDPSVEPVTTLAEARTAVSVAAAAVESAERGGAPIELGT